MGVNCESDIPTAYGVHCTEDFDVGKPYCNGGDIIYLTQEAYDAQMNMPDARWKCPRCGGSAWWDDDNHEQWYDRYADASKRECYIDDDDDDVAD